MTFSERALPYAKMGIPVFPLKPNTKEPAPGMKDWPDLATTDEIQIALWDAENPDYNCGLVAKDDGFLFFEFDVPKGIKLASEEMRQPIPKSRIHISGKGFAHHVFLQTDRTRAVGNANASLPACSDPNCPKAGKPHRHEWFSFRQHNRYVVGPGSIHPNGNEYGVARNVEPVLCPDWICDFVERHSDVAASQRNGEVECVMVEDFDFDDFCEHYGINIVRQDGDWHSPDVCPVSGRTHTNEGQASITDTGFFFDGEHLGNL
jgi:hypothetical protein